MSGEKNFVALRCANRIKPLVRDRPDDVGSVRPNVHTESY